MNKKILITILACMIILPFTKVSAGSVTISGTQHLTPGGSGSITITATSATGKVTISSSNPSVVSVSTSSLWVENNTQTITISANSVGSATISVYLADVSDSSSLDSITGTKTLGVVVAAPVETTAAASNNTNSGSSSSSSSVKKTTTKSAVTTTTTEAVTETPTTTTTTEEIVELSELKIVGYNINFSSNTLEYSLDIPDTIDELYVLAKSNNETYTVTGINEISIKDQDSISISVTNPATNTTKNYTIKLNRISANAISTDNKKDYSKIYLTIIGLLIISNLGFIIYFIKNKKDGKNRNQSNEVSTTSKTDDSTISSNLDTKQPTNSEEKTLLTQDELNNDEYVIK